MAAAQHQLPLVEGAQPVFLGPDGLDEGAAGVVGQHHHMGGLQLCPAADRHPGRDPLLHRVFAGADGRQAAPVVVVGFQVHPAHQALTDPAALERALHVDKAVHRPGQDIPAVLLHGLVDGVHPGGQVPVVQVDLRQDQAEGAGPLCRCGGPLPIGAVAGKLVAGNAAPLLQRDGGVRQQDVGRLKAGCMFHLQFLTLTRKRTKGAMDPVNRNGRSHCPARQRKRPPALSSGTPSRPGRPGPGSLPRAG